MSKILKYSEYLLEYLTPYSGSSRYRDYYNDYSNSAAYKIRTTDYGLGNDATVLQRTERFFEKMEDRINAMASYLGAEQKMRRASRGGGPDTGIELLFGLPSVVPSVLKRIFAPTKADYENKWDGIKFDRVGKGDKDEDIKFIRHTNNEFIKDELPNIRTEQELENNIESLYKRGGVKVGEDPILDDVARNRANLFFQRNK
jgi:hypothetical protein